MASGVRFRSDGAAHRQTPASSAGAEDDRRSGSSGSQIVSPRPVLDLLEPPTQRSAVNDASLPFPTPDSPTSSPFLKVRGRGGLLDGEFVKIPLEGTVTLGRSKRCGFSLKKSARYLLSSGELRVGIRQELAFRSVSRHHCSVTFLTPDLVEIENHSPNGTLVDGRRVAKIRLDDVRFVRHEIRLGVHGAAFELEYGSLIELPEDSISG